jgi:hypothetical protein
MRLRRRSTPLVPASCSPSRVRTGKAAGFASRDRGAELMRGPLLNKNGGPSQRPSRVRTGKAAGFASRDRGAELMRGPSLNKNGGPGRT